MSEFNHWQTVRRLRSTIPATDQEFGAYVTQVYPSKVIKKWLKQVGRMTPGLVSLSADFWAWTFSQCNQKVMDDNLPWFEQTHGTDKAPEVLENILKAAGESLWKTQRILWDTDVFYKAVSDELRRPFLNQSFSACGHDIGDGELWYLSKPHPVPADWVKDDPVMKGSCWWVVSFYFERGENQWFMLYMHTDGEQYQLRYSIVESSSTSYDISGFLAAFSFMDQVINKKPETLSSRAQRRRAERAGIIPPPPTFTLDVEYVPVRVHDLRRFSSTPSSGQNEVEWKYRWIVREHRRNQWYAKTNKHKEIMVPAHIKGPDDKPLRLAYHELDYVHR